MLNTLRRAEFAESRACVVRDAVERCWATGEGEALVLDNRDGTEERGFGGVKVNRAMILFEEEVYL